MEQQTILIVDDDTSLRELVRINLEHEAITSSKPATGLRGWRGCASIAPIWWCWM